MRPVACRPPPFSLVGMDIENYPKSEFFEQVLVSADCFIKFVSVAALETAAAGAETKATRKTFFSNVDRLG